VRKVCLGVLLLVLTRGAGIPALARTQFEYPAHLAHTYNPLDDCLLGMSLQGFFPRPVDPARWLVGPPPSPITGVSLPPEYWLEFWFRGPIVDEAGPDIKLKEQGQRGEIALVFLTDRHGREYFLGLARAGSDGTNTPTNIEMDLAGHEPGFIPTGIRLVSLDDGGGSPGFDIMNIQARIEVGDQAVAANPVPPDGAGNVPPQQVLSWTASDLAVRHIVYFGMDPADVRPGASPVSDPPQPQDANTYDPGVLRLGQRYFWRVDEVDGFGSIRRGAVWSFETAGRWIVDDFEFYSSATNPEDPYIGFTWAPYWYTHVTTTTQDVYRCGTSMEMRFLYDGSVPSKVTVTPPAPLNWEAMGVRSVDLFFRGQAGNPTEAIMCFFVGDDVHGAAVPYGGSPEDLADGQWRLWRIDLGLLAGVNLSAVTCYGISLEPPPGGGFGSGTMYFDDFTLYPARCLESRRPAGDIDGDCIVDYADLREITGNWLAHGRRVYPVAQPSAPLAWYRFDGDARDSAGIWHGTASGGVSFEPGVYGQAARFDGFESRVDIGGAAQLFSQIDRAITIAFWQYGETSTYHLNTLCCSNYEHGVSNPSVAITLGCWIAPGRYRWDCGYPPGPQGRLAGEHPYLSQWAHRWNHWAFVKDSQVIVGPGVRGVMRVYLNGALYAENIGSATEIAGVTGFEIGSGWYGGYHGLLDDFRIYGYALSAAEIAYVATAGSGIFDQEVYSPADLSEDAKISFQDLAIMGQDWLVRSLWP